jgi:uncharacterized protein with HEPN domain
MPSPLPERDERLYLGDMLLFCERAMSYAQGFQLESLLADVMRYDATLRNIELIGEAATHVSDETRARAPEIPWRQIIGVRNRVAHAYLGIEAATVWMLLTEHLPRLHSQLTALVTLLGGLPDLAPGEV